MTSAQIFAPINICDHRAQEQHTKEQLSQELPLQQHTQEPSNNTPYPLGIGFKQVVRTIRELREDLSQIYPVSTLPNAWEIKCMAASLYSEQMNQYEIIHQVFSILTAIRLSTHKKNRLNATFYELDGKTPLFSSSVSKQSQFRPSDAHNFAVLALAHLQKSHKYLKTPYPILTAH